MQGSAFFGSKPGSGALVWGFWGVKEFEVLGQQKSRASSQKMANLPKGFFSLAVVHFSTYGLWLSLGARAGPSGAAAGAGATSAPFSGGGTSPQLVRGIFKII